MNIGPVNLRAVAAAHEQVEAYTDALKAASAERGHKCTCGPHCPHCCREPVWVERAEARAMLATTPVRELPALEEKIGAWWDGFKAGGFMDMPEPGQTSGKWLLRYRAANLWCPFLTEDGLCGNYRWRPMACRLHLVTGPIRRCAEDKERLRQIFLRSPLEQRTVLAAQGMLCEQAPDALFEFDHLGVWLKEIATGDQTHSGSNRSYLVHSTDP